MQVNGYNVTFRKTRGKPSFRLIIDGDWVGFLCRIFDRNGDEKWFAVVNDYLGGEHTGNLNTSDDAVNKAVAIYIKRQEEMNK